MSSAFIGALVFFLGGAGISGIIFAMNLRILKKRPAALASFSLVRMLLNLGYLTAVFLLRRSLPWGDAGPLLGATLGLTIPSILLSFRLAKINDSLGKTAPGKKGDETHG